MVLQRVRVFEVGDIKDFTKIDGLMSVELFYPRYKILIKDDKLTIFDSNGHLIINTNVFEVVSQYSKNKNI